MMTAGLLVRPHSIASSPFGMLSTRKPFGSSNLRIWFAVSVSGSIASAIRSAISSPEDRGRTCYQETGPLRGAGWLKRPQTPSAGKRRRQQSGQRVLVVVSRDDIAEATVAVRGGRDAQPGAQVD